jgi:hypothetical protein
MGRSSARLPTGRKVNTIVRSTATSNQLTTISQFKLAKAINLSFQGPISTSDRCVFEGKCVCVPRRIAVDARGLETWSCSREFRVLLTCLPMLGQRQRAFCASFEIELWVGRMR